LSDRPSECLVPLLHILLEKILYVPCSLAKPFVCMATSGIKMLVCRYWWKEWWTSSLYWNLPIQSYRICIHVCLRSKPATIAMVSCSTRHIAVPQFSATAHWLHGSSCTLFNCCDQASVWIPSCGGSIRACGFVASIVQVIRLVIRI
jgi:hypothetical protein